MKLVDSNVIIYSVGEDPVFQRPSEQVVDRIGSGELTACIDVEVIQEVLHFFHTRRKRPDIAFPLCDDLLALFSAVFAVDRSVIRAARNLLQQHPAIQTRDAIHAAIVFENRLEGIISADRGLDEISGLVRFDPREIAE